MRVLVVEDEVRLADTVRRGLTAEGFNVETQDVGGSELVGGDHLGRQDPPDT